MAALPVTKTLRMLIATQVILGSMCWAASAPARMHGVEPIAADDAPTPARDTIEREAAARSRAKQVLHRQEMSFEANHGQSHPDVRFLARGRGYGLFLTGSGAVLVLRSGTSERPRQARMADRRHGVEPPRTPVDASVVRLHLAGANTDAVVTGLGELPGKANYFTSRDPATWRTNVPRYAKVHYQGVYPGVDVVYYAAASAGLEFDFIVAPGADPTQIVLEIDGGRSVALDQADLVVRTTAGDVRLRQPLVYQEIDGQRRVIPSRYLLPDPEDGGTRRQVRFEVARYDQTRPLVIDPVLVYSTYLGGADGSVYGPGHGYASGESIAVDAFGNAYVAGQTDNFDFPVSANPLQGTLIESGAVNGLQWAAFNGFVTKIDPAGTLVYSTYLGPALTAASGIAVDQSERAYVTGFTSNPDFPTTPGAYRTEFAHDSNPELGPFGDFFVAKVNATGSALIYSTFLGGGRYSLEAHVAVDDTGRAHVSGITDVSHFPTVNAVQTTYRGSRDLFVVKLDPAGSAAIYSTYLGGSGVEFSPRIAVDGSGNAYVTGGTDSADFPTMNPMQSVLNRGTSTGLGVADAFVAKLDASGSLLYSTYFGGSGYDVASDIAVDGTGSAYVVGLTNSADLPLRNPLQVSPRFEPDTPRYFSFVTKLDAAGSRSIFSTYFGTESFSGDCGQTSCDDSVSGVAVDAASNVYLTGVTSSPNFPVTSNALKGRLGADRFDVFVSQLDPTGAVLRYSTFFGGTGPDVAQDIAVGVRGGVFVTGFTSSVDFPTANAFQRHLNGETDAFVLHLNFSPEERGPLEFVTFPDVLPSLPPTAVVGLPYVGNVGIGGGQPPYRVRLVRGALPDGLTLGLQGPGEGARPGTMRLAPGDVGGPVIEGTPEREGEACFEVAVTDAVDEVGAVKRFRITTVATTGQGVTDTRTLRVTRSGSGQGSVAVLVPGSVGTTPCDDGCALAYAVCESVQLTAIPAAGSTFAAWSGVPCEGTGGCALLLSDDVTVTARFEAYPRLTVWRDGSGTGRLESSPEGILCGEQCDARYPPGTVVRLTASPDAGAVFAGWSGHCSGQGPCEVTMQEATEVRGRFDSVGTEGLGLVAAVLPSSRSVQVGVTATVGATLIATGTGAAVGCTVGLEGQPPVTLTYQPYDAAMTQPTGAVNVPLTLTAGVPHSLLLALTPTAAFEPTDLVFRFACDNAGPVVPIPGVNTLWMSAAPIAPPDVVVLVATPAGDGIVRVGGMPGQAAFALATFNIGTGAELALSADTGTPGLPGVSVAVCETEPATGQCRTALGTEARRRIEAAETPTYTVVVTALAPVELDPATHRVYVRFRDAAGAIRGSASVAVQAAEVTVVAGGHGTAPTR